MREKTIKDHIRLFLSEVFFVCIFNNPVGKLRSPDGKRWIPCGLGKGSPDLIGWVSVIITPEMVGRRVAIFVGIETKTPTNSLSSYQQIWLNRLAKDGAVSGVARSNGDAERIIKKEGYELSDFCLRMSPELHSKLAQRAEEEGVSLNQYVLYVLAQAAPRSSRQQAQDRVSVEGFEPFFEITEDEASAQEH